MSWPSPKGTAFSRPLKKAPSITSPKKKKTPKDVKRFLPPPQNKNSSQGEEVLGEGQLLLFGEKGAVRSGGGKKTNKKEVLAKEKRSFPKSQKKKGRPTSPQGGKNYLFFRQGKRVSEEAI